MGLGLYIHTNIPKRGIFKRVIEINELFEEITEEIKNLLPSEIQDAVFNNIINENNLTLQLHPSEEPVEFEVKDNIIVCSAKTNSAGPGYHAFLVEVLEVVGKRLGLNWVWNSEDDDTGDETSYYKLRDFEKLQEEMLEWLHALAINLIATEDYNNSMVSMPMNYSVIDEYYIISPMGYWSKNWFHEVANSEISKLKNKGSEFFPWWEKGFQSDFWYKCGIVKAWVDLPWHTVINEKEKMQYEFVLSCFEKANIINGTISLPDNEIEEIKQYLNEEKKSTAPQSKGIGYKKRIMVRNLTGNWTAHIHGYFYDKFEDDDATAVYWFGDKTIRGSSFSIVDKDKKPVSAEKLIKDKPEGPDIIDFSSEEKTGWAKIEKTQVPGENYWVLHGKMVIANNFCNVTICFNNEEDKNWAIETWKSVYMPIGN